MNVTVLVGNGFDLAAGLSTTPKSFLNSFVDKYACAPDESDPNAVAMAKHIQDEGVDSWASFESKLGEYSKQFAESEYDVFLKQAASLINYLGIWLADQEKRVTEDFVKRNAHECLKSLSRLGDSLNMKHGELVNGLISSHSNEHVVFNLICFNYTSTLKRFYDFVGGRNTSLGIISGNRSYLLGSFIFAHESLDEGRIVCGVDDIDQLANESFRSNRAVRNTLVKSSIQSDTFFSTNDEAAKKCIGEANLIVVFGMSIGSTDRRWWRSIYERISKSKEALAVLTYYVDPQDGPEYSPYPGYQIQEQVKGSFLGYSGETIEGCTISDRILVSPTHGLFPFAESLTER